MSIINPIRIAVLQRGWNFIGRFKELENGDWFMENPCYVIRRWGTTDGLGQLAAEGVLQETILDKAPRIMGHKEAMIYTMDVDESRWADKFVSPMEVENDVTGTPIRIAVLQRGWNLIGRFEETEKNFTIHENCYVIRRWGTDAGLGQLAQGGPRAETILDRTPTVRGHRDALIYLMEVNNKVWHDKI